MSFLHPLFLISLRSAGIGLISIPFFSSSVPFLVTSVGLFGKLCATAAFTIIYIHSSETFPTAFRNSGMGLLAVGSRYVRTRRYYMDEFCTVRNNYEKLLAIEALN